MVYFIWRGVPLFFAAMVLQFTISSQVIASDYEVEVFDQLCAEAYDQDRYTSTLLKAVKYLVGGEDGWVYRSNADFLENFGDQDTDYSALKRFADYLASKGSRLMLLYLPTRGLMHPDPIPDGYYNYNNALDSYRKKLQKLRELGILVPDFISLLKQHQNRDYFFKRDIHWTPNGARETAKLAAESIREMGLVAPHSSYQFVTRADKGYTIAASMAQGIKNLCGDQFIHEYVRSYTTEADYGAEDSGLFADEPDVETVLIGTSFSAVEKLNFVGFLQQELGAPIQSYALPAGGDDGSWLNYAASGDFPDNPPKLIIWEVPGYYLLDDPSMFAQLEPLMRGGCHERTLLIDEHFSLAELDHKKQSLFFTDSLLEMPLNEVVIDLGFSEPDIDRISLNAWYSDGKVKKETINNPARANTDGHFVFSLFDRFLEPESSIIALELTELEGRSVADYVGDPEQSSANVSVKVCRMCNYSATCE